MFQAIKIGLQFLVTQKMAYVELLFMDEKDSINKVCRGKSELSQYYTIMRKLNMSFV